MIYRQILSSDVDWNKKNVILLASLAVLPNLVWAVAAKHTYKCLRRMVA